MWGVKPGDLWIRTDTDGTAATGDTITVTSSDSTTTSGWIDLEGQTATFVEQDVELVAPEQPPKPTDYSNRDDHYEEKWGSWQ